MALDFAAEGCEQASARQQVARRQFALKALRVEVLRMLLGNPSFRQFLRTVAASDLLADFCGVRRLEGLSWSPAEWRFAPLARLSPWECPVARLR